MHYIAYIDEAGDDGFSMLASGEPTGQSQWLIIGALLVSADDDRRLPQWKRDILARFPKRKSKELHFSELKHEQKIVVCEQIAQLPVTVALTLSNKATLPGSRIEATFSRKGYLYNYLVRWLLERISAHCRRLHPNEEICSLRVVFSKRKGMNYQAMREYLVLMRDGRELLRPVRSIDWTVLDVENVAVENHSNRAGLQLADCVTSAFFHGVEANGYGHYEPRYGRMLRGSLLSNQGVVLNHGLTCVPSVPASRLNDDQRSFVLDCAAR